MNMPGLRSHPRHASQSPKIASRRWRSPGIMLLLMATAWSASSGASDELAPGRFVLDTDDAQRVTLQANGAPLDDILAELSQQLDVEIKGSSPGNSPVTARFRELPLQDALKRLTSNYMAVADESTGRIARIILLPKGDGTRYVPPPRPSVVEPPESPPLEVDPVPPIPDQQSFNDPAIGEDAGGGIDFDPDAAADEDQLGEDPESADESWEADMREDLRND
jgi:hypothetical protein